MSAISKEEILQVKKLIENAEVKEAIQKLISFNSAYENQLILLSSGLTRIEKEELLGIADSAKSTIEKNKITYAVLDIITDIEKEAKQNNQNNKVAEPNTAVKTWVYKTKKQQMYLLKSLQGLECYKEDIRPNESGHQWTIGKQQAKEIVAKDQITVNPNYTERSGTYSIGPRKSWLYSKKLFPDPAYFKSLLKKLLEEVSA